MSDSLRRVAIVGGSRIPFCRSNTVYADNSNLDMLTAAIDGVVGFYFDVYSAKIKLAGE